jgi:hypothetical protein
MMTTEALTGLLGVLAWPIVVLVVVLQGRCRRLGCAQRRT